MFCRRAWWYQGQGVESQNVAEMATGSEIHRQHGRAVFTAGCLRLVAAGLLLTAIVLLVIYMVGQVL